MASLDLLLYQRRELVRIAKKLVQTDRIPKGSIVACDETRTLTVEGFEISYSTLFRLVRESIKSMRINSVRITNEGYIQIDDHYPITPICLNSACANGNQIRRQFHIWSSTKVPRPQPGDTLAHTCI